MGYREWECTDYECYWTSETTISVLNIATNDSIQVAAVNSAGTGAYSNFFIATNDSRRTHARTHKHTITVDGMFGVRVCSLAHVAVQVAAWPTGQISELINWWLSTYALTGCVLLFLPPAFPALVLVILPSPASATAGEVVELSCSVPVVEHLGQSPTLDWSGGSVGQPGVAVADLTSLGGTIWRNISFSPLKTSHGGQYVCQANLSIPAIGLEKTWASSTNLSVQSEWLSCVLLCWSVLALHVCPHHSPQASGDYFWSL